MIHTCADCVYLESCEIELRNGYWLCDYLCVLTMCVVSLDDPACQFFLNVLPEESEDDET